MKICPNRMVYAGIAISFICLCTFDVTLLIRSKGDALPLIIVMTILILAFLLRYAATVGKVVILDSEGCTFSFMFYRKKYLWNEFTVKRLENFQGAYSYKQQPGVGAMFSIKPFHRPKWMGPSEFCMLTSPLSSFFVCFGIGDVRYPNAYTVDKTVFLDTLSQWDIEIDGS
ncbi:MAG: hypothetical protein J1F37_02925 [Oscillospiraceae bacterium]|nr:hypothetical protein [Oscillospiraceae bacterium]